MKSTNGYNYGKMILSDEIVEVFEFYATVTVKRKPVETT